MHADLARQRNSHDDDQQFWVVGGEYEDTKFKTAVGGDEEWFGPFASYQEAREEWAKHAWDSVDNAHARYRIERIDPEGPPPCTD
ncbi:MAG: DUF4170 domain-containing protein [Rhodovibrionaceae bacterium]|nr:DUF4170 domain-containing protein [Rhodovibrionaceae bacterium]